MNINKLLISILLIILVIVSWMSVYKPKKEDPLIVIRKEILELENKELYYDAYDLYKTQIFKVDYSEESIKKMLFYTDKLQKKFEYEDILILAMQKYPNQVEYYDLALKHFSKYNSTKFSNLFQTIRKKFPDYSSNELNKLVFKYDIRNIKLDEIYGLNDNFSTFILDGKYGIISKDLSVVRSNLDYVGGYSSKEKVFPAKYEDKFLFIDQNGYKRKATKEEYSDLGMISDNLAYAKKQDKYGFINGTMEEVIPFEYDNVGTFFNGIAPVKSGNKWGMINSKNEIVIPMEYDEIMMDFYRIANRYKVMFARKGNQWSLLNEKGEVLNTTPLIEATLFVSNKPAAVKTEKGWTFINKEGNLSESFYEETYSFQNNKTFIKEGGKYYFVNLKMEKSDPLTFSKVSVINQMGLAKVFDAKNNPLYISTYIEKEE